MDIYIAFFDIIITIIENLSREIFKIFSTHFVGFRELFKCYKILNNILS